ncbi:MAG: DUF2057 family protein [Halopseudomonas yangmingensis]|uniref:DUF2057 domain-containing protein n=1 Tax=Halopseudomonas yangmingensis TaxID=1720063 RepID=A0A1I4RNE9_9GAMM|nr:DUF2057 family protein [Halopseudomonas yangmingensis]SFM53752.1 hypothetical protein SAMN05216217_10794 [Halopseudomonas yangmingensis]
MRLVICLAAVALLSACAQPAPVKLYSGAELSPSQLLVVEMPNTLEVLNINGQPAPAANSMIGNSTRQLHLQPGEYRVNAYYENVYDIAGGLSSEVVRSRSATFKIDGRAGETWRLEFDAPRNVTEARELRNQFAGWAVNARSGERVPTEPGPAYVSMLGQLLGTGGTAVTADSSIAPLGSQVAPSVASASAMPAASQMAAQTLPHNDATFTTLQQIWLLLGSDSRKAFLEWAAGQGQ